MRAMPSGDTQFPEPLGDTGRARFPDPLGDTARPRLRDAIGNAARLDRRLPGAGSGLVLRPSRTAIVGALLMLAGAAIVLVARIALSGGRAGVGARIVATAKFDGVGYGLLSTTAAKTLSQRDGSRVTASGVFDVVKLSLRSADGRTHAVAGDLLSLDARGTYYGVSDPSDIGLNDRQWGLLWGQTRVPAHGSINVKAVFDVPPGVLRRPLSLHIGAFNYAGQGAVILRLPSRAPCCRSAGSPAIRALAPDPVLG